MHINAVTRIFSNQFIAHGVCEYDRRNWLADQSVPARQQGTVRRTEVSNPEIWAECFGRNPADMKAADSYAIAALMTQVEGWERSRNRKRLPIYGLQRLYVRL